MTWLELVHPRPSLPRWGYTNVFPHLFLSWMAVYFRQHQWSIWVFDARSRIPMRIRLALIVESQAEPKHIHPVDQPFYRILWAFCCEQMAKWTPFRCRLVHLGIPSIARRMMAVCLPASVRQLHPSRRNDPSSIASSDVHLSFESSMNGTLYVTMSRPTPHRATRSTGKELAK